MQKVSRRVHGEAARVYVRVAVNHFAQLASDVFAEPWRFVLAHEKRRRVRARIVEVEPIIVIGFVGFLFCYVALFDHRVENVLLSFHGAVWMLERIVVRGI